MSPKILFLDIETAPATAYVWRLFDENIGLDQIIKPGRTICWAAKWSGQAAMHYADERSGIPEMFAQIHALMSEADAICTYNGDKFDLPKLHLSFVEMGLPPPPPCASIDLLKTVRKLSPQSGKLAFIGPYLGIGDKVKHEGFKLWSACLDGDEKAWARMRRYNMQDVQLLDRLYRKLRPYIKSHPYLGNGASGACPACGSRNLQHRGYVRTKAFLTERLHCQGCGSWTQGVKQSIKTVQNATKAADFLRAAS